MSGDVQPRKRKDKRRKKEVDGFLASESATFHKPKSHGDGKPSDFIEPGERIHIQNEQGIGGNICFKIVFFCLLFVLLSGIGGIVYKLSQDSTDVEPVSVEESRFAEYFASWVDDTSNDHEHEVPETTHDDEENADGGEDEEEEEGPDSNQDDETHESEDLSNGPDLLSSFFNFGGNEETVANSNPIEESNEVPQEDDDDNKDNDNNDDDDDNDNDENDFGDKENISENGDDNEIEDDGGSDDDDDDNIIVKTSSVKEKLKKLKSFYSHKFNKHVIGGDSVVKSPKRKWKKLPNFKFDFKNYVSEDDDEINDDEDDDEKNYDASQEDENDNNNQYKAVKTTINDENYQKDDDGNKEKEDEPSYESEEKKDVEIDELKQKNDTEEPNEETDRFKNDDLGYDEIDESYESDREESFEKEETETTRKENAEHLIPPTVEPMPKKESQVTTQENNKEENNEKMTEETGGVIVKLGVGFALIIVAHLVLVQKWKARGNVTSDEVAPVKESLIENLNSEPEPIISRRQTLVPENVNFEDLDNIDEEEYLDEDGEENEDYAEGDEELEEDENTEGEEGYEEHVEKDNGNVDESLCDKKLSLEDLKSRGNRYVEKLNMTKSPFENIENDLEILDGEEELEEEEEEDYDNEYGEEEEYEEEYDAGIYGEEEEEESESFEMDIDDRVMSRNKNSKIEEDVTPVPPPRLHKRGGQSEENELENRSDEVLQQGHYPVDAMDESVTDELESETNPMEKKVGDEEDWSFRQEFQYAEEQFENNPKAALRTYEEILSKKPTNLKALINRARVLDDIAERERSNVYLKQATHAYKTLLIQEGHRLDDDEFEKLSDRCISRMRFGGHHTAAIDIHKSLIARFPDDPKHRNALAVTYLMLNHIEPARWVLNETLTRWPRNGFALVHYGFIVKTTDNNMEEGAKLLMDGIKTKEEGVNDGMFFFHLGDALNRLGRGKEALEWYDEGVKEGLFLSRYQRSLYNINRLKGRPWWTKEQTTYKDFFDLLEKNWKKIRGEGLNLLNLKGVSLFKEESENLKDTGDWRQLDLFFRGRKQANCEKAPITCSLVSSFKPASRCTRGQIKFSVMLPKTHVWPHCGPTNCRLRSHLGLIIPEKTYIRVAEETRSWEEGKVMVFDDSFEHEVWHNGTGLRLVLIVDVWHPEVTEHERRSLSPI